MSCDLEVANESACCREEISSYSKICSSSVNCFRFCPTYLTAKQPVFLRRSRSKSGQTKVGSEGENKVRDWAEKRRKPVVSPTVCSPTSDMTVRLRGRKSHAGALKSDFVGKKTNC